MKKRRESRRINCGGIFTRIHDARKAKNISSSRIFPETLVYIALNNSRNRLAATSMFLMRLFLHIYPLANDYFFTIFTYSHTRLGACYDFSLLDTSYLYIIFCFSSTYRCYVSIKIKYLKKKESRNVLNTIFVLNNLFYYPTILHYV